MPKREKSCGENYTYYSIRIIKNLNLELKSMATDTERQKKKIQQTRKFFSSTGQSYKSILTPKHSHFRRKRGGAGTACRKCRMSAGVISPLARLLVIANTAASLV
ncbi:hypothetical protein PoB_000137600 [Plakobranchus ocellatus]|uniref:Uncharacterized protein n=1 Tax=Plakobranchus ocellatus TaxID=259542 RepID=A0AAV3WZ26_9GAST|nr:hypothetical protein PoB_000137600 [Plakobranchus ocellatus]